MRIFPSRNVLTTKFFIEEALKYCDGRIRFAVDSALWLTGIFKRHRLQYNVESFR
jgi:transposase-like protein